MRDASPALRPHVRDLVELCAHVRAARAEPRESLRKIRWRRAKLEERQRVAGTRSASEDASGSGDGDAPPSEEAPPSLPPPVDDDARSRSPSDSPTRGAERLTEAPRTLDRLVAEIQRRDVLVSTRPLRAEPSEADPLGALSVPCRREGHSLTLCRLDAVRRLLVVFGGRVLRDTAVLRPAAVDEEEDEEGRRRASQRVRFAFSSAVYVLDVAAQRWQLQECSGAAPAARSDHSALFLAPRLLLVLGGRGRAGQIFGDLHALELDTWRWSRIEHARAPAERYWHSWCLAGDAGVFLFGGRSDALVFGDLARLGAAGVTRWLDAHERRGARRGTLAPRRPADPAWTYPSTVGTPPSPRFGMQVVALENDQVAVVGGWCDEWRDRPARAAATSLDVHILDAVTMLWSAPRLSALVCAAPAVPAARMLFGCFYAAHTLVVFGGFTFAQDGEVAPFSPAPDARRALYSLDLSRMIWRRQELPLPPPLVHSSAADVVEPAPGGGFTGIACSTSSGGDGGGASPELQLHEFDLPFY